MPLLRRVFSLVLFAVATVMFLAGCEKKPISAVNSGLRPAEEEDDSSSNEPAEDGEESSASDNDEPTSDGDEPAADGDADGSSIVSELPTDAPVDEPPGDEIFEVPDGTPEELVEYLQDINREIHRMLRSVQSDPESSEADGFQERATRLMSCQMQAAETILAASDAELQSRQFAAQAAFHGLEFLQRIGDEDAAAKAKALVVGLTEDEDRPIRRRAAGALMDAEFEKLMRRETKDATELLKYMKIVFEGEPDGLSTQRFQAGQFATQAMLSNDNHEQAIEACKTMGHHFKKSAEPELADAGISLLEQAKIMRLDSGVRKFLAGIDGAEGELLATTEELLTAEDVDVRTMRFASLFADSLPDEHVETRDKMLAFVHTALVSHIESAQTSAEDLLTIADVAEDLGEKHASAVASAREALVAKVKAELAGEELDIDTLGRLYSEVAVQAEYRGNFELAKQLIDELTAALPKLADEQERAAIAGQLEAFEKRTGLLGNPLAVEGMLLDGKPFDWAAYQGKVVLVDFWATWCGPCLKEIPNIIENYEKYRDQGFEVVGVNIDDDPATVVEFFSVRGELPWPTVVSDNPDAAGFDSPMAVKCGVKGIPFMVLVDREGNVETIHIRGPELGERLAEIFGDNDAPEEPSESDAPAESDEHAEDAPETELESEPDEESSVEETVPADDE